MKTLREAVETLRDSCRKIRDNYEVINSRAWKEYHGEMANRLDVILAAHPGIPAKVPESLIRSTLEEVERIYGETHPDEGLREALVSAHTVISQVRHYVSHREYPKALKVIDEEEAHIIAALSPAPAHPDEGLRAACEALMKYEKAMDGADGCGENDDLYWEAVRLAIAALSPAPAKPPAPKCTCIRATIGGGLIHLRACPVHGDKANPEAWAAEPPAPRQCLRCGVMGYEMREGDGMGDPIDGCHECNSPVHSDDCGLGIAGGECDCGYVEPPAPERWRCKKCTGRVVRPREGGAR